MLPAWSRRKEALTLSQANAMERAGLAEVVAADVDGLWEIRTGSKVGVVLGDDWELRVVPKLAVPRLMFLLAYAADPRGWRKVVSHFESADDVLAALATGFSWHASWAIDRGLLRGYVGIEELRPTLRGRLRFADQIARGGGLPMPMHVAYDDFTEDVLENRMLVTATELLLRLPRLPTDARRRLQRVRAVLEHVTPLDSWRRVAAPPVTRLNARYEAALRLAELILSSASINANVGRVSSTTFVFDMNKVFEDFVTAAFRAAMKQYGGVVRDQVTPFSLDADGVLSLKPDLSWWSGGACRAVLDAKYKAIDEGVMRHPDAYQMLAYCTAYGLSRGYLVYARDSGAEPRVHRVRNSDCEIVVATLDVELEPSELLVAVDQLAARVASAAAEPLAA